MSALTTIDTMNATDILMLINEQPDKASFSQHKHPVVQAILTGR